MTKNKKILFLIPDGVGIRNFLYSDILKNLKQEAQFVFWSALPKDAFKEIESVYQYDIEYFEVPNLIENIQTRLFREAATFARLSYNSNKVNNKTILGNWRKQNKSFKLKQLYNIAELIGAWSSKKYHRIITLEELSKKKWPTSIIEKYKNELKKVNPTSIFITHQRVASLMPICIAAKELNIPVVSAIYSWDNLPKARLNIQADKYIVWSEYMKEEMRVYYPEIPSDDIIVTGTPQFEFYNQPERLMSRNNFAQEYGLDPSKKWICYSGDDILTSPYDQEYLKDIAESVLDKNEIQILFRRCPVDFSNRYDRVLNNHKDKIISVNPKWNLPDKDKNWGYVFPKIEDVDLLVNVVHHCELVINLGSTMAHDFAMFDKPCLYINYDQKQSEKWSVKTIYNFQHFRSMSGFDAVGWLNNKEEIRTKITLALEKPEATGKDRQKWMQKIIQHPIHNASSQIANLLLGFNVKQ